QCRLSRGLPGRLPLQSGVQKPLQRPPYARRATPAGRGAGSRFPMRKTRTALQADERWLQEVSFAPPVLSHGSRVSESLAEQPMIRHYPNDKDAGTQVASD